MKQPILQRLAALMYPRRCPVCGRVLDGRSEKLLCGGCLASTENLRHNPPRLKADDHQIAPAQGGAAAFYYEGAIRAAVLKAKANEPWRAREMADLMTMTMFGADAPEEIGDLPTCTQSGIAAYDAIVPVPARKARTWQGASLPHIMAKRIGAALDVPVLAKAMERTGQETQQKSLSAQDRFANVAGAYKVRNGAAIEGKRILLVDDIITTGATVSACAAALIKQGAAEVFAISFATSERRLAKGKGETE